MPSLDQINDILFWLLLYALLWNAYILLFNRGVPNIRTAPAIRGEIIGRLGEDMAGRGKKTYTVIDLGSGNGLFSRQIARSLPQAHVICYEIALKSYIWSAWLANFLKIKNLEYRNADFFTADLSEADAVICYLTIYEMGRLGKKLHENLRPDTLVFCNRFRLGDGWEPLESVKVRTLYPHQGTFYIYRKA